MIENGSIERRDDVDLDVVRSAVESGRRLWVDVIGLADLDLISRLE